MDAQWERFVVEAWSLQIAIWVVRRRSASLTRPTVIEFPDEEKVRHIHGRPVDGLIVSSRTQRRLRSALNGTARDYGVGIGWMLGWRLFVTGESEPTEKEEANQDSAKEHGADILLDERMKPICEDFFDRDGDSMHD